MLSAARHHTVMTDPTVDVQLPPPEQDLEDGEIDDDDDEEIVTEEVIEETVSDSQSHHDDASGADYRPMFQTENHKVNDADNNKAVDEDKKKLHKKQRKRKKHRDSREKELKKRRKRKMHSHDYTESPHNHGDSLSPHSERRKKRKKHSRDHKGRESTTPDSDDSIERYPFGYYASSVNGYNVDSAARAPSKAAKDYNVNNSSSTYFGTSTDANSYQGDSNHYGSESGSDFEAQLAEYKNYKTHGDTYVKESDDIYRERRKGKRLSIDRDLTPPTGSGEVYEEFMEYDESSKKTCKFFAEGKCLKGNDCSFSHDQNLRRGKGRSRKKEMCKYYLSGHCHHGNACTYMHGDYPCKYFHTGVTCYSGDDCRFSHGPLTEETREIIENLKDAISRVDDSWEIDELRKAGIDVQSKPPPGVGLLPTPDMLPLTAARSELPPANAPGGSIPSIFDISVVPTAEFQKRIEENSVASLTMTPDSERVSQPTISQLPPVMYPPFPKMASGKNGGGLLPTPSTLPNSNFAISEQAQQSEFDGEYHNFYEGERAMGTYENSEGQSKAKSDDDVIKNENDFARIGDSTTTDEEQTAEESLIKVPDFLPATQKALFMRIHGKHSMSDADKEATDKKSKVKNPDDWTYSSDEEEKSQVADAGVIKIDGDLPASSSATTQSRSATMESLLKMISRGGNSYSVDTNLLSKVASVINMPTSSATSTESYSPASSAATYNPAQTKMSPNLSSATSHPHRERKTSGSSSTSPGHPSRRARPNPIRRRLSTQELTKEPVVIPLVIKQNNNPAMHTAHPDPRLTLSRLLGAKSAPFSATLPRFCKDLILPGSSKMELKITLSSEESKAIKRDPRLGRHKDPRLQRLNDPRMKSKGILRSSAITPAVESKSSVPTKPPALLTKSSVSIPSLPELDLNLAHLNQQSNKENGDAATASSSSTPPSYTLPNLKLPRLMKAPATTPRDRRPSIPPATATSTAPPAIAPYDPRYMSSGSAKPSGPSDLPMTTAPYDPRVLSCNSSSPLGAEVKKRTIQLPKLTPAPTYKPSPDVKPEGDQGDF